MARICDYKETTTGHPCGNTVEDKHDHCAAGHPCPPIESMSAPAVTTEDITGFVAEIEELVNHDRATLLQTDDLYHGLGRSVGIDKEVAFAKEHGIPIFGGGFETHCRDCSVSMYVAPGGSWVSEDGHARCSRAGFDHVPGAAHASGKPLRPALSR